MRSSSGLHLHSHTCACTHRNTHAMKEKHLRSSWYPTHPTGSCCSLSGVLRFSWVWVPKACSPAETGSSIFHFAIFSYLGVCEAFCLFCFVLGQISLWSPDCMELAAQTRLASVSSLWSSSLTIPKAGIAGVHYHTWQIFVFTVISVFLTNFNISKISYSGHY